VSRCSHESAAPAAAQFAAQQCSPTQVIAAGQRLSDDRIRAMNDFYQGIDARMPS